MIRRLLAIIFGLALILTPAVVSAASANDQIFGACTGAAASSPTCQTSRSPENPATNIINVAANIVAAITGIGAVIMIIISGFSFVTAGGNAEAAANARRRILYSVVGLVVVALAWAATRFITAKVIH